MEGLQYAENVQQVTVALMDKMHLLPALQELFKMVAQTFVLYVQLDISVPL